MAENHFAVLMAACVLCVAAGIGIYHVAVGRPAQERLLDELEARQQALSARQAQIEARQNRAADQAVADARRAVDEAERQRWEEARLGVLRSEALGAAMSAASLLKVMTAEYHASHGRLPESLADLGLAADWSPSPKIRSVVFDSGHRVRIVLDSERVQGSVQFDIRLHQGLYPDWQCSSNDLPFIGDFVPSCRYTGAAGTP